MSRRQYHQGGQNRGPRQQKPRPSLFLAVRVDNVEILEKLKAWQTKMKEHLPALVQECLIEPTKFHITLFVLYLNSQDELNQLKGYLSSPACQGLIDSFHTQLNQLDTTVTTKHPVRISFAGSGTFGDSILWSAPVEDAACLLFKQFVGM